MTTTHPATVPTHLTVQVPDGPFTTTLELTYDGPQYDWTTNDLAWFVYRVTAGATSSGMWAPGDRYLIAPTDQRLAA
jgi:hypothetical protein